MENRLKKLEENKSKCLAIFGKYHKSKIYRNGLDSEQDILFQFEGLYQCAKDDIVKNYITVQEFYLAIQRSNKYNTFAPSYPELKDIIKKIREEEKDKQILNTVPESHQLGEGEVVPPEKAKEYLRRIKEACKGVC